MDDLTSVNEIKLKVCVLISIVTFVMVIEKSTVAGQDPSFPGVTEDFHMVSGSENDIFSIASDGNVWHWNGVWWWQVTSDRAIEKRIHVVSSSAIYGLSRSQDDLLEICKWNGDSWMALTSNGPFIDDFHFVSENQIYAIGLDNQVHFWDGQNWSRITFGELGIKDHIQVISSTEIYGISTDGKMLKWNGSEWLFLVAETSVQDFFILKSENEIYGIDTDKGISLWNGHTWRKIVSAESVQRRIFVNSLTEIYGLGLDKRIWQWNGEKMVSVTDFATSAINDEGPTFYRAKFLGGVLESPAAILAFKERLIIAGQGRGGSVYVREWAPLRTESWDSCYNGYYVGVSDWYSLDGLTATSPKLTIENGTPYIYVKSPNGGVYRKQYHGPDQWSSYWKSVNTDELVPGPFSAAGFTVIASNHSGYPSEVSLYKSKSFNAIQSRPDWIKDLIIYEIATREFTSPNGPETGNFNSLREKLDYLEDLGITAIWLSGHSWSDPRHFANITTQYANIHPSLIDPSYGTDPSDIQQTEQELKQLVQAAHQRGIKIFLDLIAHGVMSYSPLVNATPAFPSYVSAHPLQSKITPHPDWFGPITNPSYEEIPLNQDYRGIDTRMIDYVGGYEQSDLDDWWVDLCTKYVLDYDIDGFRLDLGSSRFDLWARIKENARKAGHELIIMPEGDPDDYPFDIGVYDFEEVDEEWQSFVVPIYDKAVPGMGIVISDMAKAEREVFPELRRQFYTIPISIHDSMSYNLKGSRFEMGYGSIFTPFIPIFMAGEEINNSFVPVPNCNCLWLLSSELQWNELNEPQHRSFYLDMKKAINIRKAEPALHYFSPQGEIVNVVVVENFVSSSSETPAPYLRFLPDGNEAVLIVGNKNPDIEIRVSMNIPLTRVNLGNFDYYKVRDLWSGNESIVSGQELSQFVVTVRPDNFRVLKITPYSSMVMPPSTLILVFLVFGSLAILAVWIIINRKSTTDKARHLQSSAVRLIILSRRMGGGQVVLDLNSLLYR